jgi:hypothetical protein
MKNQPKTSVMDVSVSRRARNFQPRLKWRTMSRLIYVITIATNALLGPLLLYYSQSPTPGEQPLSALECGLLMVPLGLVTGTLIGWFLTRILRPAPDAQPSRSGS